MSLDARLLSALNSWRSAPRWRVAFSGGLDSTVLLHLLVRLGRRERLPPLMAIHVHHGLQPAAEAWPGHCQALCEKLGVPLEVVSVSVATASSMEQAARQARYTAFAERLGENEVLLTAQHRDDQAETLLFRLLRGAGVRGLAAMPAERPLGRGRLVRPLLGIGRVELEGYARVHGLDWVDDPSNGNIEYSRNYLRHQVIPALRRHWPQAASTIARATIHMAEAQTLLDELAGMDIAAASAAGAYDWLPLPNLELSPLKALSPARQRNALRHWLGDFTTLPDSDHWLGWESLRDASTDATPLWRIAAGELHRCGDRLWWLSGLWLQPAVGVVVWHDPGEQLQLPGNGVVRVAGLDGRARLEVRYRQGGEVMDVPARGRRDLKRLLNEAGVPVFLRSRLPLLYADGQLIAVANMPHLSARPLSLGWEPPAADAGLR